MRAQPNPYRGKHGHLYQRKQAALKRLYQTNGWPCPNCGKPFDFDNHNSPQGFTADHVDPIGNGGRLLGKIVAACRSCNGRRGNSVTPTLKPAS